jgi:hypothetical protein
VKNPDAGGPVSRKLHASRWWGYAGVLLALTAFGLFVLRAAVERQRSTLAIVAITAAAGALLYLRVQFPLVRRLTDPVVGVLVRVGALFASVYFRVLFWLVVVVAPAYVVRLLAELVAAVPLGLAVVPLAFWLLLFAYLVWQVSSERRRRRLWLLLRKVDQVVPFLYAFVVAEVAIVLFATLTFILSERGLIEFGTSRAPVAISEPAEALDFFSWHLLDSVPVLSITETLGWDEPFGYTSGWVGFLLLLFKVLVIVPVVATFVAFWRYARAVPHVALEPTDAHHAWAIIETEPLRFELARQAQDLERHVELVERRFDGHTAVRISPGTLAYLERLPDSERLRLLVRSMPWAQAAGRQRIEIPHLAMAKIGLKPLEEADEAERFAMIAEWERKNRVQHESYGSYDIAFPVGEA